jgi:hypothetical protein
MSEHQQEVKRLADLVRTYRMDIDPATVEELVGSILDNYRPCVEWTDETPEPDPFHEDVRRRMGGYRYIAARLRVGAESFKYIGTIPARGPRSGPEIDKFKDHIRHRLGHAVARWADGQKEGS